ncbi:mCG129719, isoform CRA_a [Mus musculus]|nr:mCG129719, isoform CRA_a [Mus musculus]
MLAITDLATWRSAGPTSRWNFPSPAPGPSISAGDRLHQLSPDWQEINAVFAPSSKEFLFATDRDHWRKHHQSKCRAVSPSTADTSTKHPHT